MQPFEYIRADEADAAIALVGRDPDAQYLAGGTTQLDLMLKDGVLAPGRLVDITRLPLREITRADGTLHVGALTTMEELAADPTVAERLPLVREALLAGASPQLRNMATIGGNVMQRTRCRYFRDPTVAACNKRAPGSGCAAVTGAARMHAILGASEHCIAVHASDLCVSLVALDAVVHIRGAGGERSVPLTEFYVVPGEPARHRERARARRADHGDRGAAASSGSAVGLSEGPRPSVVRVRAYLGGRRARDRGRHDRDGACRSGRRRHDSVACARGRGDPHRRDREFRRLPIRCARRRSRSRSPFPAPRSRSSSPSERSVRILQTISGIQP